MNWNRHRRLQYGGSAPATPGFSAVEPEWLSNGAGFAAPVIPAPESTLGSHPCVALSSAQVLPEWIKRNSAGNSFAANGGNPLNFVSHYRGSLQAAVPVPLPPPQKSCPTKLWDLTLPGRSMAANRHAAPHREVSGSVRDAR
jgi:hypothetical protein